MKDRVPRYPGRVTLTPVEGQANTYDMVRADEPTEAGTPLNTASLLTAGTAQMIFRDSNDHTVNEALGALLSNANSKAKVEIVTYVGTGTYTASNPTSVTFSFEPKFLWVSRSRNIQTVGGDGYLAGYPYQQFMCINGVESAMVGGTLAAYANSGIRITWSGNTVSWYCESGEYGADVQLNASGKTYYALAIG